MRRTVPPSAEIEEKRRRERVKVILRPPAPPAPGGAGPPFAGFKPRELQPSRGAAHGVVGGSRPPVLLLHVDETGSAPDIGYCNR